MYSATAVEAVYNNDGKTADSTSLTFDDSLGFNSDFKKEIFRIKTNEITQTSYCELPLRALCYYETDDFANLYKRLIYSERIYVTVTGQG